MPSLQAAYMYMPAHALTHAPVHIYATRIFYTRRASCTIYAHDGGGVGVAGWPGVVEVAVEVVLMVLCICIYIYTISNTYIRIYIVYVCV